MAANCAASAPPLPDLPLREGSPGTSSGGIIIIAPRTRQRVGAGNPLYRRDRVQETCPFKKWRSMEPFSRAPFISEGRGFPVVFIC